MWGWLAFSVLPENKVGRTSSDSMLLWAAVKGIFIVLDW